MPRWIRSFSLTALLVVAPAILVPVAAQSLKVDVVNSRREMYGAIWGSGSWMAFGVEEDTRTLNGDMDAEDVVVQVADVRSVNFLNTGIAISDSLADDDEDWPVAAGDAYLAIQASEAANGGKDLNGDGDATDDVLALYNPAAKQATNLGVVGRNPEFQGSRLYFLQDERESKKDLNGDGDMADLVLAAYDTATKQLESLGMEAQLGFQIEGDRIATLTNEAAQGARDLNGDRDTADAIVQLYEISQKKWTSTGLDGSTDMILGAKLVAVAVDEQAQGNQDLNGDRDTKDAVCIVWDLATGKAHNTGFDASNGLAVAGDVVGLVAGEDFQGNQDLNGDKDAKDAVALVYRVGMAKPVNLGFDASGGMVGGGGRIAFAASEADQGGRDLNRDRDTEDYVLMVYDPVKNSVLNSLYAVDGDLTEGEGILAWRVLEADQFNRDLNRDGDVEDSILFIRDLATHAFASTGMVAGDYLSVSARGVGFSTLEDEQGGRDLNMDGDADDEVMQIARIAGR